MKNSHAHALTLTAFVAGSALHWLTPPTAPIVAPQGPPQVVSKQSISGLTAEQREILSHLSIEYLDDGAGRTNKTIRVSEANLQLVNGLGATNGNAGNPLTLDTGLTSTNGLGNLIVGFSEALAAEQRSGSHNIVTGVANAWTSFGGIVAGLLNVSTAPHATVTGGSYNRATGALSSVAGGLSNHASGESARVAGGVINDASGDYSVVGGGDANEATAL